VWSGRTRRSITSSSRASSSWPTMGSRPRCDRRTCRPTGPTSDSRRDDRNGSGLDYRAFDRGASSRRAAVARAAVNAVGPPRPLAVSRVIARTLRRHARLFSSIVIPNWGRSWRTGQGRVPPAVHALPIDFAAGDHLRRHRPSGAHRVLVALKPPIWEALLMIERLPERPTAWRRP